MQTEEQSHIRPAQPPQPPTGVRPDTHRIARTTVKKHTKLQKALGVIELLGNGIPQWSPADLIVMLLRRIRNYKDAGPRASRMTGHSTHRQRLRIVDRRSMFPASSLPAESPT